MRVAKMKEGFSVTPDIEKLLQGYDFHTMYIDDYTQMCNAEERNNAIKKHLKGIGVMAISQNGEYFINL